MQDYAIIPAEHSGVYAIAAMVSHQRNLRVMEAQAA